jgi:hypothetical protein
MDLRRVDALFGAMVAPIAGMAEFIQIFTLKIAQRFDGGDDFYSMCMGCSPRVYYTGRALPFHLVGFLGYEMFPVPS